MKGQIHDCLADVRALRLAYVGIRGCLSLFWFAGGSGQGCSSWPAVDHTTRQGHGPWPLTDAWHRRMHYASCTILQPASGADCLLRVGWHQNGTWAAAMSQAAAWLPARLLSHQLSQTV
jgi:hypothetical protein